MNETVTLWILGGAGSLAIMFLGLIWTELRSLRGDLGLVGQHQVSHGARLDSVENILSKLPCYREFNCPHTKGD
jgi:hypothetical protein